jgi:hypothetical protein
MPSLSLIDDVVEDGTTEGHSLLCEGMGLGCSVQSPDYVISITRTTNRPSRKGQGSVLA